MYILAQCTTKEAQQESGRSIQYLKLRYPGFLNRRKWRPKEEMEGNGRAREGEREGEGKREC